VSSNTDTMEALVMIRASWAAGKPSEAREYERNLVSRVDALEAELQRKDEALHAIVEGEYGGATSRARAALAEPTGEPDTTAFLNLVNSWVYDLTRAGATEDLRALRALVGCREADILEAVRELFEAQRESRTLTPASSDEMKAESNERMTEAWRVLRVLALAEPTGEPE
jgi:hypothetical protein